jgi:hypothetical protein
MLIGDGNVWSLGFDTARGDPKIDGAHLQFAGDFSQRPCHIGIYSLRRGVAASKRQCECARYDGPHGQTLSRAAHRGTDSHLRHAEKWSKSLCKNWHLIQKPFVLVLSGLYHSTSLLTIRQALRSHLIANQFGGSLSYFFQIAANLIIKKKLGARSSDSIYLLHLF